MSLIGKRERTPSVRRWLCCLVLGVLALGASRAAVAATFDHASCTGDTVQYTGIAESNDTGGELYRQPSCVGDLLDFDPLGFQASVNPGPGIQQLDGNVVFTISALSNLAIDSLTLDEGGDWQVDGFSSSSTSRVSVTLSVRLEIIVETSGGQQQIDFFRRTPVVFDTFSSTQNPWSIHEEFVMAFILGDACAGAGYFDPTTGGDDGGGGVGAIAAACGATTSEVGVNIDNTLNARAESGELAQINKKDLQGFSVTAETDPVPEPATAALLALGLATLGVVGRRR